MEATVRWIGDMSFVGETGSGHSAVMDGSPDHGGRDLAPRPMEMVLLGLGGCSAFDVVAMLKKSRQDISDCRVELTAQRADTVPAVFTAIHMKFLVQGVQLQAAKVERAVALSAEKYCSVSRMLEPTVAISHEFVILEP